MKIILASASKYRKELLEKLGISFECIAADIDETPIKNRYDLSIEQRAIELACAKAKAIQVDYPNSLVIGSDQICHMDNEIFSKSGSIEKSQEILEKLSGKTHYLSTAYCIAHSDIYVTHINTTALKMRNLSSLQIKKYLRLDNPIDCAGSYKLELNGISLFEKVETQDYTAIVGLPLVQLGNDLNKMGITVPG